MPPHAPLAPLAALLPGLLLAFALLAGASPAEAQAAACKGLDESLSGAYQSDGDGALLSVLPGSAKGQWQLRDFGSGRSVTLHPAEGREQGFQSGADLAADQPVAFRYEFQAGAGNTMRMSAVSGGRSTVARRIALRERTATITGADKTALYARLTLPALGAGPFKAVIFVHGSDATPSVGQEWLPHLLAAHGIATLVFDKRGTGCSQGQYVQHFGLLSDDVLAAAQWLRSQPEIRKEGVGLAGFSQGGWVAPLAALKDGAVSFVAVGFGMATSMAEEDRLEAPLKLRASGVDAASVAEFIELNAALHRVAREGFKDWSGFETLLARFKDRPWFAPAARQQSWFGVLMQMGLEQAKAQAPGMFQHFFQPFYDPVPTLEQLKIPMLWLMAGQDIEAPPEPTLEILQRLRAQGKPVTVQVFPNADHGIQDFVVREGRRVRTKYADGYFAALLKWIQDQK